MKTILKVLGGLLLLLIVVAAGGAVYLKTAFPKVGPAKEMKVVATPERIERGKYLANHVTVCVDCHSTRDWSRYAGPIVPGSTGKGGEVFDQKMNFPGRFLSRNITPSGIGRYTDGELYRTITTGVTKEGRAMFPVMPYPSYGKMCDEDIQSIIAYIRTLAPIENKVEESVADFPVSFLINTNPHEAELVAAVPAKSDTLHYGGYLVNAAGCAECHTKMVHGDKVKGMDYAGGFEFNFPNGNIIRSANLTPDKATGIGNWTKEAFINRFKAAPEADASPKVGEHDFNTPMPWIMYKGMTEEDLAAIFKYLQTVKPINNTVEKFTPAGKSVAAK